jgi:hypothetical protein
MALMPEPTRPVSMPDLPQRDRRLRPRLLTALLRARVAALLRWPFALRTSRTAATPPAHPPLNPDPRRDGMDVMSLIALGRSRMPPRPAHKEIQR